MSLRKAAQLGGKDAKLKADPVPETPQQVLVEVELQDRMEVAEMFLLTLLLQM